MKKQLTDLFSKIEILKKEIEAMRPLPAEREGRIFQKFRLDWNFHSNAIEGNSLTYGETNAFLMEGLTAKGKPLKDHLDLKGHNEAIDFLKHFIDKNEEITERDIRELHKMILVEPYKSKAITPDGQPSEKTINIGQYKTQPNHVQTATGEMFYFASPEETPAKMHDLMEGYRANRGTIHPVELAALFHYDFVRIHPFDDGNGRMSRLLMNFILMQFGFPPVVIKASKDKKAEYFYALQMADKGGKDVFVEYIGEQLVHSMEVYLRGARGEDISEVDSDTIFQENLHVHSTGKSEIFECRDKFIETVDNLCKEVVNLLKKENDDFSFLARHLHAFIHERVDAILVLLQNGCYWDADAILRSVAEASVKLVYLCTFTDNLNRNQKVSEFWKDLGEINRLKQSKQVKEFLSIIKIENKLLLDLVLSEDKSKELSEKWTKPNRQKIEQSWSYNEMVKTISNETNRNEIHCLARNFTQSSHIIHADETALGVIFDRKNRNENEKAALIGLHEIRLMSDIISFYQWVLHELLKLYSKQSTIDLNEDLIKFIELTEKLKSKFSPIISN